MSGDKSKIFDIFEYIREDKVNNLDDLSITLLRKSYLIYRKASTNTYELSTNGKLLQKLLKVDKNLNNELVELCECQGANSRSYEECLSGAIHYASTYIRCRGSV